MPVNRGAAVEDMSWDEVMARFEAGALPVLAIGAACKEHGLHLPMNTDYLQAQWLATQAMTIDENLLIFPTLNYGYYPAFVEYPGSVTLEREHFKGIFRDIADAVFRGGALKFFVIDTGISTITPLDEVAAEAPFAGKIHVFHSCLGDAYQKACQALQQQLHGGSHADEMETSFMMAIAPEVVRMSAAVASPNTGPIEPGPLRRRDASSPNFSPSGVIGDPTDATVEKGRTLAAARVDDLTGALLQCRCLL